MFIFTHFPNYSLNIISISVSRNFVNIVSISYKNQKSYHYPESVSITQVPVYNLSAISIEDLQLPVKRVFSQL